ncbi:hypothetical protein FHX74_002268 [Friedmanniella endophytica]|uniref:Uncharacterized protein n=1 Tax=Microlunatus kandeliicorticis TaxID=1759536 RepID=A0A7W3ISV8_9ACTN|nr:hypothetical protein [Microlunatus kandeliicorticis]MBA8794649.1 hypothetical protein [Microlunatus kandeliicorticis]
MSADPAPWDRALGWALTGHDHPDWPDAVAPDLDRVLARLAEAGESPVAAQADARATGQPWPHPVPDRLRAGLGAAQLAALMTELMTELQRRGLPQASQRAPVIKDRAPGPDELRLLRDVPPHY